MEKNIDILQFLDGALSHEEEAELLHRLSVSPERRDVLRSYIDQRAEFQRDREAINVPYGAEQKLWARLGEIMPVAPLATATTSATTAVMTATRGFRWFSAASVGAVCVVIGLLAGYYFGRNSANELASAPATPQSILAIEQPASNIPTSSMPTDRREVRIISRTRSEAPLAAALPVAELNSESIPAILPADEEMAEQPVAISYADARSAGERNFVLEPRERSHSLAGLIDATQQTEEGSYKMELSFAESFGKQFPEDAVSRNTQPIITNSAVSGMYQVYRGPLEVWAGVSIGSANFARQALREDIQQGGGSKIVADIAHMQTTWVGPIAQARHRLNEKISLTASGGASYSDLGPLFFGELGGRYDLTDQVGITVGLRSFHLQYDLTQEHQDLVNEKPWLDLGGNKYGAEWSHNLEFLTGMYFRF